MTRTMSLLEERITMTEDRLSHVVAYSRGMVEVPTTIGRAELPKQVFEERGVDRMQGSRYSAAQQGTHVGEDLSEEEVIVEEVGAVSRDDDMVV